MFGSQVLVYIELPDHEWHVGIAWVDLHTPIHGGNTAQHSPCAEVHSGSVTEPESPVPDHGSWGRGLVTSDWTEQSFLARLTLGDPQTPVQGGDVGGVHC